jgi:hypothetical protein
MFQARLNRKEGYIIEKLDLKPSFFVAEHSLTSFEMGWTGSVKISKNSFLWMHHHDHFKNGEYILADKGNRS